MTDGPKGACQIWLERTSQSDLSGESFDNRPVVESTATTSGMFSA
jgi:hypothetical protein